MSLGEVTGDADLCQRHCILLGESWCEPEQGEARGERYVGRSD